LLFLLELCLIVLKEKKEHSWYYEYMNYDVYRRTASWVSILSKSIRCIYRAVWDSFFSFVLVIPCAWGMLCTAPIYRISSMLTWGVWNTILRTSYSFGTSLMFCPICISHPNIVSVLSFGVLTPKLN